MVRLRMLFFLISSFIFLVQGANIFEAGHIPLVKYQNKSYYFSNHFQANWYQASQVCTNLGMRLVTVPTEAVNNFLYNVINTANTGPRFWTGGTTLVDGENWLWISNTKPIDYTYWMPGQPETTAEKCLEVWLHKSIGLKWNNLDCNGVLHFICETPDFDEQAEEVAPTTWVDKFSDENLSSSFPVYTYSNNIYFVGSLVALTYIDADRFCKLIGMDLVFIESEGENDFLYKIIRDKIAGVSFWSGGSRSLNGEKWYWSLSGEEVFYTNWLRGTPDNKLEQCIQLLFQKDIGLMWNDGNCAVPQPFICKAPRRNINKCSKLDSTFKRRNSAVSGDSTENIIKVDESVHVFSNKTISPHVPTFSYNKSSYYIGRHVVLSYLDASRFCKLIGMELVSIESEEENNIIYKHIRDTIAGPSFWSGGTRYLDGNNWYWLPSDEKLVYTSWLAGTPNNILEQCIQLIFQRDIGLKWNDLTCTVSQNFICEGLTEKIGLPNKNERDQPCPIVPQKWITLQLFKESVDFSEAIEKCKSKGMKLVSIRNRAIQGAVNKLIQKSGFVHTYWTSANKQENSRTWRWLSGETINEFFWDKQEKLNLVDVEYNDCIYVKKQVNTTIWRDSSCNDARYYICETPSNNMFKDTSDDYPFVYL